jgi:16S rRNA (uracil1498-N3)-methyltransferase
MQFTFSKEASSQVLQIDGDIYKYLFKARRHKVDDEIYFRNLNDKNIYLYKVIETSKRNATLSLLSQEEKIVENKNKLHLVWCIVDPKIVEKSISSLNELGVTKITFVYCDYSQNNFKINIEKLEKILINSSSQCGRSSIIKLNICNGLNTFLQNNKNIFVLNFSKNLLDEKKDEIKTLLIGCEGGFSADEVNKFDKNKVVGFDSSLILRSETAIISASSKILI